MVLMRMSILAMATASLFDLAGAAAIVPVTDHGIQLSGSSTQQARKDTIAEMIVNSIGEDLIQRQNAVHRCYPPSPAVVSHNF
ncbi:uncharacterized protein GGS22DRAFT_168411 [Annulohypoxylon maeteangense]|uniref:uncharacterized protein n=1 Tax=Annulohypoxylon maeteangense TaxID=1927788 RepID=UPI0020086C79|nr:uncharacterized protein GGS22DRAFT_168411 [Annulohypoxylon maeteangense]KAI0883318.1 hypothetical protein GGS22DRAFT_168411 [Annulohypoxylon maeteangense]